MAPVDAHPNARWTRLSQRNRRVSSMTRERIEGTRKQAKERRKQKDARLVAEDRTGSRPRISAKSQKAFGIRADEAERQIRELQSRYG